MIYISWIIYINVLSLISGVNKMNADYFSIKGKDGAFFVYMPHHVEDPEYIIVISPGLAEHAARYNRLSSFLKNHNVQLYCIDHIGQGIYATNLGVWPVNGFEICVNNMKSLIDYAHENHKNKKIVLFGHSMGSFMSLSYIEQFASNIDACILSGTNDQQHPLVLKGGKFIAMLQELFIGRNKNSKILNSLSFGQFNKQFAPNRTEFDWLSRDEKEVDKYIQDPLCGYVPSVGLFKELFKALSTIYKDEMVIKIPKDLPIHLMSGANDPVGGNSKGPLSLLARLEKSKVSNITVQIFDDMRHECLNEIGNDVVMKHVHDTCKNLLSLTDNT